MSNTKKSSSWKFTKGQLLTFGSFLFTLGVATSVTSTYAWYSLNTATHISNIDLKINVDEPTLKLWLALDKTKPLEELVEGVTLIHKEEGYTMEELGMKDVLLTEVSSMYSESWLKEAESDPLMLPKFRKPYRPGSSTTKTDYCDDKDVYVQDVFYIESDRDCTIYLDGNLNDEGNPNTLLAPNHEKNNAVAEQTGRNVEDLDTVANAVRVSFFTDEGYIIANPGKSVETVYGGLLDLNQDGYYDVDSSNKEILYGQYEGNVNYKHNSRQDEPYQGGSAFKANHMPGCELADLDSSEVNFEKENSVKLDDLTLRYDTEDPYKNEIPICHLRKNEKKRLTVSIYVEGWDLYMTNLIASASFDIALSFTATFG